MVHEAIEARKNLPDHSVEIISVNSIKSLDETVTNSIKKTGKVITVEDHNVHSGLGNQVAMHLQKNGITTEVFKNLGTEEYELSGKSNQLYAKAGIDAEGIQNAVLSV